MNDLSETRLYDAALYDDAPLSSYVDIVLARWRLVLGIAAGVFLLGLLYAVFATPVYRVDATIQVNESTAAGNSPLHDIAALLDNGSTTAAELELVRARMVIDAVVTKQHLNLVAEPRYVPLIGRWVARRYRGEGIAPPLWGLSRFAWGGERFDVATFETAGATSHDGVDALDGLWFTVTALDGGRYMLRDDDDAIVLSGAVGAPAHGEYQGKPLTLLVAALDARPGTTFRLKRIPQIEAVAQLQDDLSVEEKAKQSGILSVTLEGDDKVRIREILKAVVDGYVAQNRDYRSKEAAATLESLKISMPAVEQTLKDAEERYAKFRARTRTVDLDEQGKLLLGQEVDIDTRMLELKQKRVDLIARFADGHPAVQALDANLAELAGKAAELRAREARLPDTEREGLAVLRDVRVNTELYTNLLNTAQQLNIAKQSEIGNVRAVDQPVLPVKPVKPKRLLVIALSLCVGIALGVAAPFAQRAVWGRVEHPEHLEQALGVPVYAVVPHSREQRRIVRSQQRAAQGPHVLASEIPEDVTVDAIRSLRTTLQFTMSETGHHVIMVTSPQPNAGKSFLCANLASLFASGGKRVLLIDADIRRGQAHRHFGLPAAPGLPDVIASGALERGVQRTSIAGVDVLPRGAVARTSELFNDGRFKTVLDAASRRYDIVIVDTAPILALHDAATIGRHGATTLLCVRHGRSSMPEIREAERRLRNAGIAISGVVLNDVPRRQAVYGTYGERNYAYETEH
ncbi:polysaccharide biosynthesis tyrosine autokinase [Burkholderia vietnamiensis]|uniref:polysaccharide biosynthesis tyrosine autokinase n=1 Tax=Burkholderia vietnamiensis TaxID=60552 RepID=UPI00264D89F6|nr:polysaccharide biosynthesis tyrosine autokinase [Burkholderia vietnamiensis]MDN7553584.1 polysaccharide biosynthesis tyrosine autokinase [Burkholderia vietnamiensis]HDR9091767.1 polysaccharide biosynthesis tyrosine autokinase [Burkholderia vietnamiensis]